MLNQGRHSTAGILRIVAFPFGQAVYIFFIGHFSSPSCRLSGWQPADAQRRRPSTTHGEFAFLSECFVSRAISWLTCAFFRGFPDFDRLEIVGENTLAARLVVAREVFI